MINVKTYLIICLRILVHVQPFNPPVGLRTGGKRVKPGDNCVRIVYDTRLPTYIVPKPSSARVRDSVFE